MYVELVGQVGHKLREQVSVTEEDEAIAQV